MYVRVYIYTYLFIVARTIILLGVVMEKHRSWRKLFKKWITSSIMFRVLEIYYAKTVIVYELIWNLLEASWPADYQLWLITVIYRHGLITL